jgi:epoxyqueuosine reductase
MRRFTDLLPGVSGNAVNGLGEMQVRRPSPFFWHPADRHDFGPLQTEVIAYHRQSPAVAKEFSPAQPRGPKPIPCAAEKAERAPEDWTKSVKAFALAHEGDLVGITPLDPLYVYEGYEIKHPTLIMIGVSMDYDELSQVPPSFENPSSAVEVARQYNRASRVCRELANFILAQGYEAETYPGPYAKQLNMIPAAIAAGLGQLGKHDSMINRTYGSSFRLSAVSTDMPLICDVPDEFGSEDFCTSCQLCVKECPARGDLRRDENGARRREMVRRFRQVHPLFRRGAGLRHLSRGVPMEPPGHGAEAGGEDAHPARAEGGRRARIAGRATSAPPRASSARPS